MNEFKLYGTALEMPILIETKNGTTYCNVYMAVDRASGGQDKFKITFFKSIAEDICENMKKGDKFIVKGCLVEDKFDISDNDNSTIELIGKRVEYI